MATKAAKGKLNRFGFRWGVKATQMHGKEREAFNKYMRESAAKRRKMSQISTAHVSNSTQGAVDTIYRTSVTPRSIQSTPVSTNGTANGIDVQNAAAKVRALVSERLDKNGTPEPIDMWAWALAHAVSEMRHAS